MAIAAIGPSASNFGLESSPPPIRAMRAAGGEGADALVGHRDLSRLLGSVARCQDRRWRVRHVQKALRSAGIASRTHPVKCVVTVETPGWLTPRVDMHWCSASIRMATPPGASAVLDRVGDLGGQCFLRLQALGENLDDAGELRQSDDAAFRDVGDVRDADERRDVVLAMALDADVAQHDHVVVAVDVLEGAVQALRSGLRDSRGTSPRRPRRRASGCRAGLRAPGSSPAQAISVRTAASASALDGRLAAIRAVSERRSAVFLTRWSIDTVP